MASGYSNNVNGSFTGTGAEINITKKCTFIPRRIDIYGEDGSEAHWLEDMADGEAIKRIIAGTGSKVTTQGITPVQGGFTLGTDAFNAAGVLFHYTLWA